VLGSFVGTIWDDGRSRGESGDEAYTSVEFRRGEDENPLWFDGHVATFPELERLLADVSCGKGLRSAY